MTLVGQTPKPVFISELPAFLLETTQVQVCDQGLDGTSPTNSIHIKAAIKQHIGF